MPSLSELTSSGPVVLVDPGVLRDMAASLNGLWQPDDEESASRRDELVAAARLRLYAERDRSGWMLVSTRDEREALLARDRHDFPVAFVGAIEDFDDAPPRAEVDALERMFREEGVGAEPALSLACAYLSEYVRMVVTRDARSFRHSRSKDLPAHLELVAPDEAVERLGIAAGEKPPVSPPGFEGVGDADAWWIP